MLFLIDVLFRLNYRVLCIILSLSKLKLPFPVRVLLKGYPSEEGTLLKLKERELDG